MQSANSFKILDKLKIKDDDIDKYDIELFLRTFNQLAINDLISDIHDKNKLDSSILNKHPKIGQIIEVTSNTIRNLKTTGINKISLLDTWILDVRKIWRD